MAKRRPQLHQYDAAETHIGRMERAVVKRMVDLDGLDANQFVSWLLPPETEARLRAVYGEIYENASEQNATFKLEGSEYSAILNVACHDTGLPYVRSDLFKPRPDAPHADRLMGICRDIADIVSRHDKLRRIVSYFNSHEVTLGAAKHYFPSLRSLLPADHPFQQLKSDRFRPMGHLPQEIIDMLRDAPQIVASGVLCNPVAHGQWQGSRDNLIGLTVRYPAGNISQRFMLVGKKSVT